MTDLIVPEQIGRARLMAREADTITIAPWPDPVMEARGFPLRHPYVETFYAAVLGPTGTLMLRRWGLGFAVNPDGFTLDVDYLAALFGMGAARGRHSPLERALYRLQRFHLATSPEVGRLLVRRAVPRLSHSHVVRMPELLQADHAQAVLAWEAGR